MARSLRRTWLGRVTVGAFVSAVAVTMMAPSAAVAVPDTPRPDAIGPQVGGWGGYSNGQIPLSAMSYLGRSGAGTELYLRADAANSFIRMQAAYRSQTGGSLDINEGYRDLATQWYYWDLWQSGQGYPAAYPGTSNHGWALAADFALGGDRFSWLQNNAPAFGWSWDTGRAADEPWHWEYVLNGPWPADGERVSDFSGDGFADVLGVDSGGKLLYYPNQRLSFPNTYQIGEGWSTFRFAAAADWSGDGAADVLGVNSAGELWYYPNQRLQLPTGYRIGQGWSTYRHMMAADWSGDGAADVLGVNSAGELWYFPHSGGGFGSAERKGFGWSTFRHVMAADWSGDGAADIIGVDSSGNLWYYPHQGSGLGTAVKIGHGWSAFKFVHAADLSGDGAADILGVDSSGNLWYYPHHGAGLTTPVKIGHGWSTFKFLL